MQPVIKNATYVTEWDDGQTIITSKCQVDLLTHTVTSISTTRHIQSSLPHNQIDDCIEILDSQYILFPDGTSFPVITKNDTYNSNEHDRMPFLL